MEDMTKVTDDIVGDIRKAAVGAFAKHGPLTRDLVRACAILGREWGEATDEALLLTMAHALSGGGPPMGRTHHLVAMYDELAQVAATAAVMMAHIEEDIRSENKANRA